MPNCCRRTTSSQRARSSKSRRSRTLRSPAFAQQFPPHHEAGQRRQQAAESGTQQDSSVRFALNSGLAKNASTIVTFNVKAPSKRRTTAPCGLRLAYVGPIPPALLRLLVSVSGYGINRFTSTRSLAVPAHDRDRQREAIAHHGLSEKECACQLQDLHVHVGQTRFRAHHCGLFRIQERRSGIDLHVFSAVPPSWDRYASTAI